MLKSTKMLDGWHNLHTKQNNLEKSVEKILKETQNALV